MPAVFDKLGVRFEYPDNWTVEEPEDSGEKSVAINSPGGAFWSLVVYPAQANLEELAETAVGALREEYSELDAEEVTEVVADQLLVDPHTGVGKGPFEP